MSNNDSIFGIRPEKLDRLLRLGLHEPKEAEPPVQPVLEPQVLAAAMTEQPGTRIGRYRLLETIGEGGMGVVYLAEQAEPVRRQVALKIIKPGMDSHRVLARFEAEEQALAMMEHPNIARVYDAGVAPSGRPYFVMEHVHGLPITEHCDTHRLTIEQRLRLFLRVCEAVQHAHQKGIIHRDLKPSNILVAVSRASPDQVGGRLCPRFEGGTPSTQAIPKVIDFGVARAISQPLTQRTLYTEQGQLIGTPEYMSPEQANPINQDIDTRTDIYSLGVVLYELLAGVLPFDSEAFRTGGIDHIRKVICEEDPKTPSSRVHTAHRSSGDVAQPPPAVESRGSPPRAGALHELAERRQTDVRTLQRTLHGDLDWITLKAIEKDRVRRYATVDALAADIRNYLSHQPVSAASPGALYRARKFARRHRQAIAAASGIALLLVVLLWALQAHVRATALEHERILANAWKLFDTRGIQAQTESDASSKALAMIEPLLTSRHVGPKAQLLYATILVEHRYYDEAAPRLQKLLNGPQEIAGAAYALFARVIWEGPSLGPEEVKKAEEYQKKAEELLPETAEAYYVRAMAALTIPEKLKLLGDALSLDSAHYPSRRLRALTYQASRKYELLRDDALIMIDRWPKDPLGYSLRAMAFRESGRYQEAIADYNDAIARTTEDSAEYLDLIVQRCETFLRMGDYERVLTEAQPYLSEAGQSAWGQARLWRGANANVEAGGYTPEAGAKELVQYHAFCALTALGRYEEASALYRRIVDSERAPGTKHREWHIGRGLKMRSVRYILDTLDAGRPWHPPDRVPAGPAFLAMFEAEQMHRDLCAKAKARRLITDAFAGRWSPDGTKVVFSLGVPGNSGVAVYDRNTGQTDLLIVPGRNPVWSPDGQYIAFIRDRSVLRLSEFTGGGPRYQNRIPFEREVWVMNADGTEPRRLASRAEWPSWSADSRHVYYQEYNLGVRSISIEDAQAKPVTGTPSASFTYAVSPDGKYVAQGSVEGLQITEVASQARVANWVPPLFLYLRDWSPDGREISLAGLGWPARSGLWIYDFDSKEVAKVLSGYVGAACWSADKTKLLIGLVGPYNEIWVADLPAGLSTVEALGGGQTIEEHCREWIEVCTRELAVDPNVLNTHWERIVCALQIRDSNAPLYLQEHGRAIDRALPHPSVCYWEAAGMLLSPSLRDWRRPLISLYACKAAERDSGYARALAPLFQAAGQREEAERMWQMGRTTGNFLVNGGFEDGDPRPWKLSNAVEAEVVTELRGAAVPEKPVEGKYCLYVDVAPDTPLYYLADLRSVGAVFEAGKKYTASAFLKARKGTLDIYFKPEQAVEPYTGFGEKKVTITDTWAQYHMTTPVFMKDIVPARLTIKVGAAPGGFWIDDVKFYEGDYVPTVVRK